MDKGAAMVARILIAGILMGLLVAIFYPAYRKTAQAIFQGTPEKAPIWLTNERYYPAVRFPTASNP